MTRVFIWKNNCPQEWEEISFTAFRKARSSGAFSGRFFNFCPESSYNEVTTKTIFDF